MSVHSKAVLDNSVCMCVCVGGGGVHVCVCVCVCYFMSVHSKAILDNSMCVCVWVGGGRGEDNCVSVFVCVHASVCVLRGGTFNKMNKHKT